MLFTLAEELVAWSRIHVPLGQEVSTPNRALAIDNVTLLGSGARHVDGEVELQIVQLEVFTERQHGEIVGKL